eukprot:XP_001705029.1 Hypothetical protein GL50803_22433 [Giardia lamblia ATCC 50803]
MQRREVGRDSSPDQKSGWTGTTVPSASVDPWIGCFFYTRGHSIPCLNGWVITVVRQVEYIQCDRVSEHVCFLFAIVLWTYLGGR